MMEAAAAWRAVRAAQTATAEAIQNHTLTGPMATRFAAEVRAYVVALDRLASRKPSP
jgi:hypothetical protein